MIYVTNSSPNDFLHRYHMVFYEDFYFVLAVEGAPVMVSCSC